MFHGFSIEFFGLLCAGITVFLALIVFGTFRLGAAVRLYGTGSLFLALWIAATGWSTDESHLFIIAGISFFLKSVFIPALLVFVARRTRASLRLRSYVRPTPSFFIAAIIIGFVVFKIEAIPVLMASRFVGMAFMVLFIGLVMMVLRRDLFSQIIGFLTLENGLTMFLVATIENMPLLIEFGITLVVIIGIIVMSLLSRQVRELYGTEDTSALRELSG